MKRTDVTKFIGKQYGYLTIVSDQGVLKWRTMVEVLCICGKTRVLKLNTVTSGSQSSCGCVPNWQKNISNALKKHGLVGTPEYNSWTAAHARCYNEKNINYKNYGGRGITMCDRWKDSPEKFLEDMGKKPSIYHTIERKNNDGNYEPSNCVWATRKEQRAN